MSCSSQSHPSPSDDISLSESLATISLSADSSNADEVEEFESDASNDSITPIATTVTASASTDSNSPANSDRSSHSRDLSFDSHEAISSSSSDSSTSNSGISQTGGQQSRGINEKRPSQYDNRRNLHVDNLPPMTEVEFRNLFLTFGSIARSRIVTDAITGLPAGYGFVMFENEGDAVVALQSLHNTYLPNSTKPLRVTVKKPKTAKAWEREREKEIEKQKLLAHGPVNIQTIFVNTNLYVAGLPANWTKREMDEIFSQFGMILESRILLEKHSHVSKGVGFVRFQQLECCHQAIQALNGKPAPVPASLKANGKGNASAANPNGNREDSKQNLTVRFAVDKTAQALAVAQQTVMGTLNQQRGNSVQTSNAQHHHSHTRSEANANVNNQKYFAVLNSGALPPSHQRSNSPSSQTSVNVHAANAYGAAMNGLSPQQLQSYLTMQHQQFARVAALATVGGSNRPSFSATPASSANTYSYSPSPQSTDLSAFSLENALLLSQLNSPLTSSAMSLNSLAAAAALTPINLSSLSLAPASTSAAALNQYYAGNSLSTLSPYTNQVFV